MLVAGSFAAVAERKFCRFVGMELQAADASGYDRNMTNKKKEKNFF